MTTLKRVLLAMFVLVAVTATSWAAVSKTLIVGSPHDLTAKGPYPVGTASSYEVCDFCHVAHKLGAIGSTTGPGYLLWNHKMSAVTAYGVYSSELFNALNSGISDLGALNTANPPASSNLCLSCHDGTVAISNTSGYYTAPTGVGAASTYQGGTYMPSGFIVEDLTKSHPVHFQYTTSLASAAGVLSPASASWVDSGSTIPLFGGYLECATCHDPHNYANSTQYPYYFIQNTLASYTGAGTSMCCYCHT